MRTVSQHHWFLCDPMCLVGCALELLTEGLPRCRVIPEPERPRCARRVHSCPELRASAAHPPCARAPPLEDHPGPCHLWPLLPESGSPGPGCLRQWPPFRGPGGFPCSPVPSLWSVTARASRSASVSPSSQRGPQSSASDPLPGLRVAPLFPQPPPPAPTSPSPEAGQPLTVQSVQGEADVPAT